MVSRGAAGSRTVARQGVRWRRFPRRDIEQPISVTLRYGGGGEAWVVVRGRGETNVYPGHVALIDLLLDINNAR